MLPTREAILQYHETLPDNIKRTTAGKFYKAFASDPQKWTSALYDAGEWFAEMYSDGEDYSENPVVLEASGWSYASAISMFATLKKLSLHAVIKDEHKLYRLHDLALDKSRFQPRVGDVLRITPHKSCLSFSRRNIQSVPGRSEGKFDVILECAFQEPRILWNYDCTRFLRTEHRLYEQAAAGSRSEQLLDEPAGSMYGYIVDIEKSCSKLSAIYGLHAEETLFYLIVKTVRRLIVMPLTMEDEVVVHTGMKPFEAMLSSIVDEVSDED